MAHEQRGEFKQAAADQAARASELPWQIPIAGSVSGPKPRPVRRASSRQLKGAHQRARNACLRHYHFATAYAALEDKDGAFRYLFESCAAHEMWISFIQIDPKMDALRGDPRYAELQRRISLNA